jgi:lipopolysaccharide transport system permease protein
MTSYAPDKQVIRIEPMKAWERLNLREIWDYRELLYFLIWRDMKVAYARTKLGIGWALLKPMVTMGVLSLIFGWLTEVPSDGVPYPVFVCSALLPWQLFARVMAGSASSMAANEHLITKVHFPRLIAPLSVTATAVVDFAIGFLVVLAMVWYYRMALTAAVLILPLFVLLSVAAGLGVGLWISGLNVLCRDVGHAQAFVTQLWLFATPVIYPGSLIPERWKTLYALNPMAGVVEGFRAALLHAENQSASMIIPSVLVTVFLLISGLYFFKHTEQMLADRV